MCESESDTDRLLVRAQAGEFMAIDELMRRYRLRLKQMIRIRMDPSVRGRIDESDVIQDALAAAAIQLTDYLNHQAIPFYPWLRRIAWQKLVHAHEVHLKASKRSVRRENRNFIGISDQSASVLFERLDPLQGNGSSPSAAVIRGENRQRVRQALNQLDEIDREILVQRYVEQMQASEIAASLDLTDAAVHMRHMRALKKMRRILAAGEQ